MNQDPNNKIQEEPETGRPANWQKDEMRPDRGDPETPNADDSGTVPSWNEGQMAEERKDGTRHPAESDEEIESESAGGLSGGGVNPGGGERWAERDKDKR